jgi:hypothetical protein
MSYISNNVIVCFLFFDEDVDECMSNPCTNNGTCVDGIGSYQCNCSQGYHVYTCDGRALDITHSCVLVIFCLV